jgi:hypothetical protein
MSETPELPIRRTRAEINRENAQKSTGPKTAEGKTASAKNAFKHGFYSKSVCIPGEDPAGLDALSADLRAEHQPATTTEELLVDELAQHYWRMKRYRYLESTMWQAEERGADGKLTANLECVVWTIESGIAPFYQRALASAERAFYKALNALRQEKKQRGFVPASDSLPAAPETDSLASHSGFVPQVSTATAQQAAAAGEAIPSLPDISGFVSTKTSSASSNTASLLPAQLFKELQSTAGFTPLQIQAALEGWRKQS